MIRTETLKTVPTGRDSHWHREMQRGGFTTAIARDVCHRHLSLLNYYDYADYDQKQRDDFFNQHNPDKRLVDL
jgi:hypothetical protein